MNANAIKKVNHFGKAGKIVMTILLIAAILVTLVSGVATIYTATLPKDAVKVTVTNHAEFKIDEGSFPAIWSFLVQHVSYAADQDPSARLKDDGGKVLPPEGTELHTNWISSVSRIPRRRSVPRRTRKLLTQTLRRKNMYPLIWYCCWFLQRCLLHLSLLHC